MTNKVEDKNHYRFHAPHLHLTSVFGKDWFALKEEAFARFFGTPKFLIIQTVIVTTWICLNAFGVVAFDLYPFILLNLVFSLQAAYAAPLILLAQTRQADRDKAHSEADAQHREDLAKENSEKNAQMLVLLQQNTELTSTVKGLTEQINELTAQIHKSLYDYKK